uniref:site-specific DNA-methyltransferase (adenine-specific) n=1 Tax=mine drainage metagenome TaxID=410659 RepID=E6QL98_9ZZZZ
MMPVTANETINEVDFCAKVCADVQPIFAQLARCPFVEARVEGMGSTSGKTKRKDLRFYDSRNKVLLTGEVKLPGGVSAFDSDLVQDAQDKADHAGVQYFFTWDVNTFVLWDRYRQDRPLLDRRIKVWHLRLNLTSAQQVARPETLEFIKRKFLPDLIAEISDIVTGIKQDWALPPDEIFLRSLESHLDWPVTLLRQFLQENSDSDKHIDAELQSWMTSEGRPFLRSDPAAWRDAVDNAARTLAYVWTNRLIFYKALRARFPELPRLELGPNIKTAEQAVRRLTQLFNEAARASGDYETLLFPNTRDWANDLVFAPVGSVDAWRSFLRGIEMVDFRDVPADIVGLIFQKLISPEERYRLGQHFTGADPVDLINSFCIRSAAAVTLDPACGSGSFLVRAYYRKRAMNFNRPHSALLGELYGADIALYPAHLATLNLAAREINDEANYPRIARTDFFDITPDTPFCELPIGKNHARTPVPLPKLDAIVGNPPYVRQEKVSPTEKQKCADRVSEAFPGTQLRGRADLHCYFWPHATRFLREGGYFGFLTSGQWLDVDYGFALQRWILLNFRIVAIMESATERWFPDARVKTCITILQRCSDESERRSNRVRFIRFEKPLADLIGVQPSSGVGKDADQAEQVRQHAVDLLRDAIENVDEPAHDDRWRILLRDQDELWEEGVRSGRALKRTPVDAEDISENEDEAEEESEKPVDAESGSQSWIEGHGDGRDYVAGKWGRYLRAPDFYFEVMQRFRDSFTPLGQIVDLRFGVKTGCDAFFMPRDVSKELLARTEDAKEFRKLTGVARERVVSGEIKIVRDGANTLHPIESLYLKPEVHSLMKVDRPVIRARDLDRVVFLADDSLEYHKDTFAYKYMKYGERATYASKKSKAVPVPERSSCAGRHPWYDLTKLERPGFAFWPMAQQYRHIISANPENLICNHNLFDLSSETLAKREKLIFVAILNSTLIGLFKTFYGRFAGTEGNLKTEVVDVNLIDVPNPRLASPAVAEKLTKALEKLNKRPSGRLVEEALLDCHSYQRALELASRPVVLPDELTKYDRRELDDAVFELLGVEDATERRSLVDRLYIEVASHFRAIRVTEIQKMEDRAKGGKQEFKTEEFAADAWDALDLEDVQPAADWLRQRATPDAESYEIPTERPVELAADSIFEAETVYFGKRRKRHIVCPSPEVAGLVASLAEMGFSGSCLLPNQAGVAKSLSVELAERHRRTMTRMKELVDSRTSDSEKRDEVLGVMQRWFVLGRRPTAEADFLEE